MTTPYQYTTHNKRSLAQQVVDDLSDKIRTGVYKSGEKLPTEPEVMAEMGVSRTVVREAMSHLQASGLVETRHGIGSFVLPPQPPAFPLDPVSELTLRDVIAMLELRISLETEAASLAAERRTDAHLQNMQMALDRFEKEIQKNESTIDADFQFHLQIALATGNRYFEDILHHLGTATIPRARLTIAQLLPSSSNEYLSRTNREHKLIFDAIARKDAVAARAAMRKHLVDSKERLRMASQDAPLEK